MNQCYHNGNFYQCVEATSGPAQSPTTALDKWSQIEIPKAWRLVLARFTFAELLEIDGQKDKAKVERDEAQEDLNKLVRVEANREGWRQRPNVTPSPAPTHC